MRTLLFLGGIIFYAPLYASQHIYNEHEITPDEIKKKLPNSEKLHEKIGKKGFYEKQYATITFKKKTSEAADLTKITLQWNGPHITQHSGLSGSLFKTKPMEELIAIHDNQVATSNWNEKKQQIIFIFKAPYPLNGTTRFSIVLTVNHELDALLQNGSFSLITASLPDAFQTTKKEPTA